MSSNQFHINPETFEVNSCGAKIQCRFGESSKHFDTVEEARTFAEKSLSEEFGEMSKVEKEEEIYIHPQGKRIEVKSDNSLVVTKNGKKATSSATLDELRSGRGAWKKLGNTESDIEQASPVKKLPKISPTLRDTAIWMNKNGWDGSDSFRSFSPLGIHKGAQVLGQYGLTLDDFNLDSGVDALDFFEDMDGFGKTGSAEMRAMPAENRKEWRDTFKKISDEKFKSKN